MLCLIESSEVKNGKRGCGAFWGARLLARVWSAFQGRVLPHFARVVPSMRVMGNLFLKGIETGVLWDILMKRATRLSLRRLDLEGIFGGIGVLASAWKRSPSREDPSVPGAGGPALSKGLRC